MIDENKICLIRVFHIFDFFRAEQRDPFAVGTGDLDPLAGGMGGGMLMDPRRGFPGPGRPRPGVGLPGRLPP